MPVLEAIHQANPKPVSSMSVETIHPSNEQDNIFKQLDEPVRDAKQNRPRGNIHSLTLTLLG